MKVACTRRRTGSLGIEGGSGGKKGAGRDNNWSMWKFVCWCSIFGCGGCGGCGTLHKVLVGDRWRMNLVRHGWRRLMAVLSVSLDSVEKLMHCPSISREIDALSLDFLIRSMRCI